MATPFVVGTPDASAAQPPNPTSISPTNLGRGATGVSVTIGGQRLAGATSVTFSGTGVTASISGTPSNTSLTALVTVSSSADLGAHDVSVTDANGTGTLAGGFTVNAAPTVSSTNPSSVEAGATNQTVLVNGSDFVSGATVAFSADVTLNGGVTFLNSSQLSVNVNVSSGAASGSRTVTVTNPDSGVGTCSCFSVAPDTTAPDTTITSGPADPTNLTDATFSFTSSESGSTFECQLDTGGFSTCSTGQTYNGLIEGSHTFEVKASDAAANTDQTPASFTWTIDLTSPGVSIDSGPTGATADSTPTFDFSSADNTATFTCSIDTGAASYAACSDTGSHTPAAALADGGYTFRVKATDPAGNFAEASQPFSVDTTASVTIDGGPSGPTADATPTFEFSSTESGTSFECSIDTGIANYGTCSDAGSHTPASDLSDGSYTFHVRATDGLGNTTEATQTFSVDTATDVSIDSGPTGATADKTPTFTFSSTEPGTSFECSIDTGIANYGACSDAGSHTPASDLSDGSYTFRVRATDGLGNKQEATQTFSVDTTANVSIDTGPSGATNDTTPTWTFSSTEPATFECSVDSGTAAYGACSGPGDSHTSSTLTEGDYVFHVRATDGLGNTAETSVSFTVDTTPPGASVDGGPSGATNDATPTFSFSSPDNTATFQCSIETGSPNYGACSDTGSHTPSSDLADGAYTFAVKATDPAGNFSEATQAFVVDATTNVTIDSGPSGATNDATPTFGFSTTDTGVTFECSIDTGTASYGACSDTGSHTPSSGLADGGYTFRVRATDTAGNTDEDTRTFTVDTDAPSASITSGPGATTKDSTPTFTFESDDNTAAFQCSVVLQPNAASYVPCSGPGTSHTPAAALAPGDYTFSVKATDAATNFSEATQDFSVLASSAQSLCGRNIKRNIKLTENITCDGAGLVLAAKGITLNLNGFTISGNGVTGVGVAVTKPGARVLGPGLIEQFATGIRTHKSEDKVKGVEVADNDGAGIQVVAGRSIRIVSNNVHDNGGDGILLDPTVRSAKINNNVVTNNGGFEINAPNKPGITGTGNTVTPSGDCSGPVC